VLRICLHVLQTAVQIGQHICELFTPHQLSSAWRIEPFCGGLEVHVVAEILLHILGQLGDALLVVYQALALCSERGRLRLDGFEGRGERGEDIEGGRGVCNDVSQVATCQV
jgi:hypothetical protein